MNPYTTYYVNQVGTGLPGFQGLKYQKGHGFFGRLISNTLIPLFKTMLPSLQAIGAKSLPSVMGLASDIISGENVKQSAINRLREGGKNMAEETLEQLKSRLQSGSGRRRKRRRSIKKKVITKRRKTYKKRTIRRKKKSRLSFLK